MTDATLIKAGLNTKERKRYHEIVHAIFLLATDPNPYKRDENYRKQEKLGDELCTILYPKDYETLKKRGYL